MSDFSCGAFGSDGGSMLLRQLDAHLSSIWAAALAMPDPRDPERILHGVPDLLAHRMFGLC